MPRGSEPVSAAAAFKCWARHVELTATSHIDASGAAGGGTALIGGDWQGSGATPRAANTTVEPGSRINADALSSGDGGKVVVWSDGTTRLPARSARAAGRRLATAARSRSRARARSASQGWSMRRRREETRARYCSIRPTGSSARPRPTALAARFAKAPMSSFRPIGTSR